MPGLQGLTSLPGMRILPVEEQLNATPNKRRKSTVNPKPDPNADAMSLDPAALAKLSELDPGGRNGLLGKVLGAFETSLARMCAQLEAERGKRNAEVVARVAHTLKSSSQSVGALELHRTCLDVERRLRDGLPGDMDTDIERLLAACATARLAVGAMLHP